MNIASTTVTLPPFLLVSKCSLCRLFHEDRELFDEINSALIGGVRQCDVIALARKRGQVFGQSSMSKHLAKHLRPHISGALMLQAQAKAFAEATSDKSNLSYEIGRASCRERV